MALTDLEKARSNDALGRVLVAGLGDLLKHSIRSQVVLTEGNPGEALAAIERELCAALEAHEIDPLTAIAYREGLRADLKTRIGIMLRAAVSGAADDLGIRPPPRAGSH